MNTQETFTRAQVADLLARMLAVADLDRREAVRTARREAQAAGYRLGYWARVREESASWPPTARPYPPLTERKALERTDGREDYPGNYLVVAWEGQG